MGLLYDAFVSLYTEYNEHWQSAYEDDEYDGEDPTARIGDWMHSHLNNEEFSLNWCSSEDHCGLDAFEELYSGKYGDGMFTSPSTFVTETLQIYHQYNGEGEWTFFNETVRSVVTRDEQATPAAIFERLFEAYAVDVEGEGKVIT